MGVTVTKSGPLFDGSAPRVVEDMMTDVEEKVGQELVDEIVGRLRIVLRHPTGHYARQIRTTNRANDTLVTDGGVVYGPWLEGVSRRNKRSRFKGYATFRQVAQRVSSDATQLAEPVVERHVGRLQ